MEAIAVDLLVIAVLILFNAIFAGSELAVVSLRPAQIRRLRAQRGQAGERVAQLAADPSRFLSTVQVGITLGGFLASATAAVALAKPLERRLGFLGDWDAVAAVIIVTLILTFVTLVLGELVPKRIALQRAEGWSLRAAGPLMRLASVASPAVWVLSGTTDLVVRLLGGKPDPHAGEMTEEEIRDLIAHQPGFSGARRTLLQGAFDVQHREVRDILVPRRNIEAVADSATVREAIATLVAAGHSRAPVLVEDTYRDILHLQDLVAATDDTGPALHLARPALVVPETIAVLDLLRQMQTARQQMALVANEHGTIEGLVTIEDVLEEIVGEIYDEFDRDLNEADERSVRREPDGAVVLPGAFPLHDLTELDFHIPNPDDQTTIAGAVIAHIERIPRAGEIVMIEGIRVTVLEVEGNAIVKVRLQRGPGPAPA